MRPSPIHRSSAFGHPLGARALALALATACICVWDDAAAAAARTPAAGTVLDNPALPALGGGKRKLLGEGPLDVLVFLRPGQAYSADVLPSLEEVRKASGDRVRWTTLVADRFSKKDVAEMTGGRPLGLPLVFDTGSTVRTALGVVLEPVAALVGKDHKFVRLVAFRKINFGSTLHAYVRHALGEIDDEGLERALDPTAERAVPKASGKAKLYLKLGRRALEAGRLDSALEAAHKAIAVVAELADAHVLLGDVLAAKGDCKAAIPAYERALGLQNGHPEALKGKQACAAKP